MESTKTSYPFISMLALTGGAYALWCYWSRKQTKLKLEAREVCEAPTIGNFQNILKHKNNNVTDALNDLAVTYGSIFFVTIKPLNIAVINSRELIELVGVARTVGLLEDHPLSASRINEAHSSMHPEERSFITLKELKSQCRKAIKCYGCEDRLIGANILIEMEKLIEQFRTYESSEEPFDAFHYIHLACANVLCTFIFGCRYKYKSRRLKAFTEIIHTNLLSKNIFKFQTNEPEETPVKRSKKKNDKTLENLKHFLHFIKFEVESHKKNFNVSKYRDFVDIYLKSLRTDSKGGNPISSLSFESTVVDMFTYGVEPISAFIMWAIYCMVEYPDVQMKCHDEIDEIVGHGRPVTLEDRKNLVYICATLKEVMRRFTVVPFSMPLFAKREFKLGPYDIARNTTIVCNYHAVHMDSEVWNDPTTFNPERFKTFQEDGVCKKFFNFGSSGSYTSCPASCLSQKIVFIIFTNLLQKFDFEKDRRGDVNETFKNAYNIIKHPPNFCVKIDSH